MKKILLSMAILAGAVFMGNAQTLTFLDKDGNPIQNGSTFVFEGYKILQGAITADGFADGFVQLSIDPELSLKSSEDDLITVSAESLNGSNIELCAGSNCITSVMQNPIVKSAIDITEGGVLGLQFAATAAGLQFMPGAKVVIPYYEALLTAFSEVDPENKISITVKMGDPANAGVAQLMQDANKNKGTYNLNGVKVDSENLTPGIYVVDGKKIVVK